MVIFRADQGLAASPHRLGFPSGAAQYARPELPAAERAVESPRASVGQE